MNLLQKLMDIEGYEDSLDMLEHAVFDGVAPGICTNCKEYTIEVEPDCRNGYCEDCGTQTVKSCLVLAGVV